ncbi:MAG TPA: hypothetical protein VGP42_06300 [Stellaceae bacterium]|jgi:hypothetical protein|nr:hypothetical protein [Stellaceae bacterium]
MSIRPNAVIRVRRDPDLNSVLCWSAFVAENEFNPEELAEIEAELAAVGHYVGGGGAAPIWSLEVIKS